MASIRVAISDSETVPVTKIFAMLDVAIHPRTSTDARVDAAYEAAVILQHTSMCMQYSTAATMARGALTDLANSVHTLNVHHKEFCIPWLKQTRTTPGVVINDALHLTVEEETWQEFSDRLLVCELGLSVITGSQVYRDLRSAKFFRSVFLKASIYFREVCRLYPVPAYASLTT